MLNEKLEKKLTKTVVVKHAYPVLRGVVKNHSFFYKFFREMLGHLLEKKLEAVFDFPEKKALACGGNRLWVSQRSNWH